MKNMGLCLYTMKNTLAGGGIWTPTLGAPGDDGNPLLIHINYWCFLPNNLKSGVISFKDEEL